MQRKIFDCTMLSEGEEDLMEIRLRQLWDIVDLFVIVEGNRYFAGQEKDLQFERTEKRFRWAQQKLAWKGVELYENPEPWQNETHQRDTLLPIAKCCGMEPEDVVILSDIDEIPNLLVLEQMIDRCPDLGPIKMTMDMYYLYLNNRVVGKTWNDGPITSLARHIRSMDNLRRSAWPTVVDGGWHFQYVGGPERFRIKMKTGSHAHTSEPRCDDVPQMTDIERIKSAYTNPSIDLFAEHHGREVRFEIVSLEELPPYVAANPEKFAHLIFREEPNELI